MVYDISINNTVVNNEGGFVFAVRTQPQENGTHVTPTRMGPGQYLVLGLTKKKLYSEAFASA